ncbi:MAG: hypothetical protein WCA48_31835 [Pseudomonas gingeri]
MTQTAPPETPAGPPPANWIRVYRRGSLTARSIFFPQFIGWLEADGLATNFDVLVDFSSAQYTPIQYVYAAIYTKSTPGSGKVYRAQYQIQPSVGVSPSTHPSGHLLDPTWSSCVQAGGVGGLQFLIHAGGVGGLIWGLEMAAEAPFLSPEIDNLIATGIAHGREL